MRAPKTAGPPRKEGVDRAADSSGAATKLAIRPTSCSALFVSHHILLDAPAAVVAVVDESAYLVYPLF